MSTQGEYQAPLVESERNIRKVWKVFIGSFEILKHGLVSHQIAQMAHKQFQATHIYNEKEYVFETALEMYKEPTKRIDGLEEKGFKLLTYISAISAILIYFLSKDITDFHKFFVILSLFFLTIAIIISLRCISIKYQKVIFIDILFNFEPDSTPVAKDRKAVTADILNCAVYNQTVADNTADVLRATRIMLSFGIFTKIISCIFFLATPTVKEENKLYNTKVTLADIVFRNSIISLTKSKDESVEDLKAQIVQLNKKLDSLSDNFKSRQQNMKSVKRK